MLTLATSNFAPGGYTAGLRLLIEVPSDPPTVPFYRYDKYYSLLSSEFVVDDYIEVVRSGVFLEDVKRETNLPNAGIAISSQPRSERAPRVMTVTVSGAGQAEVLAALRIAYRRELLAIAGLDVGDGVSFVAVSAALADLADAVLEAALAISRAEFLEDSHQCTLAVVALGKSGGRELNYISDVDVLFIVDGPASHDDHAAHAAATRLAQGMMRACSAVTPEGSIWEVDPNLRPEGRAGALVRTLPSFEEYYQCPTHAQNYLK